MAVCTHGRGVYTKPHPPTHTRPTMEEHKAPDTGGKKYTKWARTPTGRAFTWTLPAVVSAGDFAVPTQAWMVNGSLERPWLSTATEKDARKWPHVATSVWSDGPRSTPHTATVAWNASGAKVSVDRRRPVALEGGFDAAIPATTEFAVGVDGTGRALVVQAVSVAGRAGLTLNRWAVHVDGSSLVTMRQKPLSVGRDVVPIEGSLAVAAIGPYMEWAPETADTQKPHWCVTWAAWMETVVQLPAASVRNDRLPVRVTAATVGGLYLHVDGVTLASPHDPFAHSLPVSSQVSDWRASVHPISVGGVVIPVTCVWCGDVILTAWPSRKYAGFKDSTRIAAAPWSTVSRTPAMETPLTGFALPVMDNPRGDVVFAFLTTPADDTAALRLVTFNSKWPLDRKTVTTQPVGAPVGNRREVEAATRRLGLPWARILGVQDDAFHVALLTEPTKAGGSTLGWRVVSVPL